MSDKSQFQLGYAGETPADPPATAQSQLTCHVLHVAEFEAELQGGWFTWWPHGVHMAFHVASHARRMRTN